MPRSLLTTRLSAGIRFFQKLVNPETRIHILSLNNPVAEFFTLPEAQRLNCRDPMMYCARRMEKAVTFFSKPTAVENWRKSVVMMPTEDIRQLSQWATFMTKNMDLIQHAETRRFNLSTMAPLVTQFWYPTWSSGQGAELDESITQD